MTRKCRKSINLLIVILASLIIAIMIFVLHGCSSSSNITTIKITRGVAEVTPQQELSNTYHWRTIVLRENEVAPIVEDFKKISVEELTDNVNLTEVEYMEFVIQYSNETTKSFCFLYDFFTDKEYLKYDNQLYRLTDYSFLWDNHLQELLFLAGDARIYRNSNINTLSFRYKQRWTDGLDYYEFLFQAHDFANIQQYETNIDNREKAIEHICSLLNFQNCKSLCFYDKTMDYYFVELYNPNGFSVVNGKNLYDERFGRGPKDLYAIVDSKGSIIELYSMWKVLYEEHFEP